MNEQNKILRLLTVDGPLIIKATTGKRYLAKAKRTFQVCIGSNFKNWNLDKTSYKIPDTAVDVHEVIKDATLAQIFGSLSDDLNKLCLTQDQIEEFCLKNHPWLRNDCATFFIFEENEHYFVAGVGRLSVYLSVDVGRLEDDDVLIGESRHRIVVPQLSSL